VGQKPGKMCGAKRLKLCNIYPFRLLPGGKGIDVL
jgi:hypothetical protein